MFSADFANKLWIELNYLTLCGLRFWCCFFSILRACHLKSPVTLAQITTCTNKKPYMGHTITLWNKILNGSALCTLATRQWNEIAFSMVSKYTVWGVKLKEF